MPVTPRTSSGASPSPARGAGERSPSGENASTENAPRLNHVDGRNASEHGNRHRGPERKRNEQSACRRHRSSGGREDSRECRTRAPAPSTSPVSPRESPYDSTNSAPMKTSVPAQPEKAKSSPVDHRTTPGWASTARKPARAGAGGVDGSAERGRHERNEGEVTGAAIQASLQLASPTRPDSGIPTIQASGGPSSAMASTRERSAGRRPVGHRGDRSRVGEPDTDPDSELARARARRSREPPR